MKRRTPIRKVSKKMAVIKRQYMKQRAVFLEAHPWCEVYAGLGVQSPATDIHHMKGRGKYMLDETTWMAVCRGAHTYIHDNPSWAREMGYILPRSDTHNTPNE